MRNLLFILIITLLVQSCAPLVGTVGMVWLSEPITSPPLTNRSIDLDILFRISSLFTKSEFAGIGAIFKRMG